MNKCEKGSITVFLSLIFILVLSLLAALLESISVQSVKRINRASTFVALESVFAEYQTEMLEEYGIFVVDGSYGKEQWDKDALARRMDFYGARGMTHELEKMELLSDASGRAFYVQVLRDSLQRYGLGLVEESEKEMLDWESRQEEADAKQDEEQKTQEELETMLQESEENLPAEDNPIQAVNHMKSYGLLELILPEEYPLSEQSVDVDSLPSHRNLNQGFGEMTVTEPVSEPVGKVFLQMYLTRHFSNATKPAKEHSLQYELEYLLEGEKTDAENLEKVTKKILAIRLAINYAYLLTDEAKMFEAETMALTLCSLLTVPSITKVVKHAILLAWSYAESLVDMKTLLDGKKVPAVKTSQNWRLGLSQVVKMKEDTIQTNQQEEGLTYLDYLKGFLLIKKKETLCIRALDLLELNTKVKVDHCITQVEYRSLCSIRPCVTYQFKTWYGYQ